MSGLTPEIKAMIDGWSYQSLLRRWRFTPIGDPLFQGESGIYFSNVIKKRRVADPKAAVKASKKIGW